MRLAGQRPAAAVDPDPVQQLQDLGGRLAHVVGRYQRLVTLVAVGDTVPDLADTVAILNSQVGFVARRLQELVVLNWEAGQAVNRADADQAAFHQRRAQAPRRKTWGQFQNRKAARDAGATEGSGRYGVADDHGGHPDGVEGIPGHPGPGA